MKEITFEDPDMDTFLGLPMAMDAARKGGSMPTVFNAANELAVKKFLQEKNRFSGYLRHYCTVYGKTYRDPESGAGGDTGSRRRDL